MNNPNSYSGSKYAQMCAQIQQQKQKEKGAKYVQV